MNIIKEVPDAKPEHINKYEEIEPSSIIKVKAISVSRVPFASVDEDVIVDLCYQDIQNCSHGSFGIIFKAKQCNTEEIITVKQVLQNSKRIDCNELNIARAVDHQNILKLKYYFYTYGKEKDEIYTGLIYEDISNTILGLCNNHSKKKTSIPKLELKVYSYQIFRGLAYLHSYGICHQDIKPGNILVNTKTRLLKICGFSCANILDPTREIKNLYFGTHSYRAPEILFSSIKYTVQIDVWSAGCVIAHMILISRPLFIGNNNTELLVEVMKILGSPTIEEMHDMNEGYNEFPLPKVISHSWRQVFEDKASIEEIQLFTTIMKYSLEERPKAFDCLALSYFDELRVKDMKFENNEEFPPLFNFTEHELDIKPELNNTINPEWNRGVKPAVTETANKKSDQEALDTYQDSKSKLNNIINPDWNLAAKPDDDETSNKERNKEALVSYRESKLELKNNIISECILVVMPADVETSNKKTDQEALVSSQESKSELNEDIGKPTDVKTFNEQNDQENLLVSYQEMRKKRKICNNKIVVSLSESESDFDSDSSDCDSDSDFDSDSSDCDSDSDSDSSDSSNFDFKPNVNSTSIIKSCRVIKPEVIKIFISTGRNGLVSYEDYKPERKSTIIPKSSIVVKPAFVKTSKPKTDGKVLVSYQDSKPELKSTIITKSSNVVNPVVVKTFNKKTDQKLMFTYQDSSSSKPSISISTNLNSYSNLSIAFTSIQNSNKNEDSTKLVIDIN